MIETAVAIIATCLPRRSSSRCQRQETDSLAALRTLILGHSSTAASNSNYRHYELSSAGHRRTHQSRVTTNIIGGTQHKGNDSEDELVKGAGQATPPAGSGFQDKDNGIMVSTTFQVQSGMDRDSRIGYDTRS